MDLVMDALATGCMFKNMTCVVDFTKESLTVTAAFGISCVQVTRILDSVALFCGCPGELRTNQGAVVEMHLIQPGRPAQDGFIKIYKGRFRIECLNEQWFSKIVFRKIIMDWRLDFNECRPHSSLNNQTPS